MGDVDVVQALLQEHVELPDLLLVLEYLGGQPFFARDDLLEQQADHFRVEVGYFADEVGGRGVLGVEQGLVGAVGGGLEVGFDEVVDVVQDRVLLFLLGVLLGGRFVEFLWVFFVGDRRVVGGVGLGCGLFVHLADVDGFHVHVVVRVLDGGCDLLRRDLEQIGFFGLVVVLYLLLEKHLLPLILLLHIARPSLQFLHPSVRPHQKRTRQIIVPNRLHITTPLQRLQ